MTTFSRHAKGAYDPEAGTFAAGTNPTVTGSAIQVRGDARRYRALSLVESEAPTLLFTPTTYGELPAPGDTVEWNDVVYRVRSVDPVGPDGVAIMARVIVAR